MLRVDGRANVTGSPPQPDLARVRLVHAGEHLDQGRLAGAVLADQGVHLAGVGGEVHAGQGMHAGEALVDVPDGQDRVAGRGCQQFLFRGRARLAWRGRVRS